jgi:hypothetical protein
VLLTGVLAAFAMTGCGKTDRAERPRETCGQQEAKLKREHPNVLGLLCLHSEGEDR